MSKKKYPKCGICGLKVEPHNNQRTHNGEICHLACLDVLIDNDDEQEED